MTLGTHTLEKGLIERASQAAASQISTTFISPIEFPVHRNASAKSISEPPNLKTPALIKRDH